jgi:hypothetical protein
VHAINTLLQGPIMNEWSLAKIAQDLDALELSLMASQGLDTEDYKRFAAEESGNVAGSGMFSIQVRLIWYGCCVWGQMHTREQFHMFAGEHLTANVDMPCIPPLDYSNVSPAASLNYVFRKLDTQQTCLGASCCKWKVRGAGGNIVHRCEVTAA